MNEWCIVKAILSTDSRELGWIDGCNRVSKVPVCMVYVTERAACGLWVQSKLLLTCQALKEVSQKIQLLRSKRLRRFRVQGGKTSRRSFSSLAVLRRDARRFSRLRYPLLPHTFTFSGVKICMFWRLFCFCQLLFVVSQPQRGEKKMWRLEFICSDSKMCSFFMNPAERTDLQALTSKPCCVCYSIINIIQRNWDYD